MLNLLDENFVPAKCFPGLALNCDPLELHFLSTWDCRCAPLCSCAQPVSTFPYEFLICVCLPFRSLSTLKLGTSYFGILKILFSNYWFVLTVFWCLLEDQSNHTCPFSKCMFVWVFIY
jgi:hypothetical protein